MIVRVGDRKDRGASQVAERSVEGQRLPHGGQERAHHGSSLRVAIKVGAAGSITGK